MLATWFGGEGSIIRRGWLKTEVPHWQEEVVAAVAAAVVVVEAPSGWRDTTLLRRQNGRSRPPRSR